MHSSLSYVNVDTAERIALQLYPSAKSVTMVEHGYDNTVALVDDTYAVRFPRGLEAGTRSQYEKHILEKLENSTDVTIPIILGSNDDPAYLVTSFVPGKHISTQTIKAMSTELQRDFAKKVAKFAYTMHSTFELSEELKLRRELELDDLAEEPWPLHFSKTTFEYSFPTPQQDALAKKYYAMWNDVCNVNPQVVVHDDLHAENMLFDSSNQLVGILDFGDTNVGTPEQDLRQLYRVSEDVLLIALQEYERLSGSSLNPEAAKIWAITQELAVYSEKLANDETGHRTFKRACRNLNDWLNEGDWGKEYNLSDTEGYQ